MIEKLNDVFENDELFFWCNCLGEINMPGDGNKFPRMHSEDELPSSVHDLYEMYFCEDNPKRYIVSFQGKIGVFLDAIYDEDYVAYLMGVKDATPEVMEKAFYEILAHAAVLNNEMDGRCTILVGDCTDPDGHELSLFIPGDLGDECISKCIREFNRKAYIKKRKYLISVQGKYVRNVSVPICKDSTTGDFLCLQQVEGIPLLLGFFDASSKDHAIRKAIDAYKNQYSFCPECLEATEVKMKEELK